MEPARKQRMAVHYYDRVALPLIEVLVSTTDALNEREERLWVLSLVFLDSESDCS